MHSTYLDILEPAMPILELAMMLQPLPQLGDGVSLTTLITFCYVSGAGESLTRVIASVPCRLALFFSSL